MNKIFEYIKPKIYTIIFFVLSIIIFAVIFALYGLPLEAVLYAALLSLIPAVIIFIISYLHYQKKHHLLEEFLFKMDFDVDALPVAEDVISRDYTEIILAVCEKYLSNRTEYERIQSETIDYYTVWAHQIKTPIAAMRLITQSEESEISTQVKAELFKTEQYVDMVLAYLRADSDCTDYLIRYTSLEEIVKQSVRHLSPLFIRSKISAVINIEDIKVLTDEKWLMFMIEQLLSNSLKYTPREGCIRIYANEGPTLVIEDNGIGIAAEDLPRVFEKGFTGYNGRSDKKATGIGLYIVKKISSMLNHPVKLESQPGKGTKAYVYLGSDSAVIE